MVWSPLQSSYEPEQVPAKGTSSALTNATLVITTAAVLGGAVRLYYTLNKKQPGSLGWPLLGNTPEFVMDPSVIGQKSFQKYGRTYASSLLGYSATITGYTPEDSERFWKAEQQRRARPSWPHHFLEMLRYAPLFTKTGSDHGRIHSTIAKVFAPLELRSHVGTIDRMMREFPRAGDSKVHASNITLMVFFAIAGFRQEGVEELTEAFNVWSAGFGCVPIYFPGTTYYKSLKALQVIDRVIRSEFERTDRPDTALISRVLKVSEADGDKFSKQDILLILPVLTFAGFETTASIMSDAIYYLGTRPDVVDELRKELIRAGITEDTVLDYEKATTLPYLTAFTQEMFRLDNPVNFVFREATEKAVDHDGNPIPEGILMMCDINGINHNPNIFSDPKSFKPERWVEKDDVSGWKLRENMPPLSTFGGGSRLCVGRYFARLELFIFIMRVVQLYDVKISDAKYSKFPFRGFRSQYQFVPRKP